MLVRLKYAEDQSAVQAVRYQVHRSVYISENMVIIYFLVFLYCFPLLYSIHVYYKKHKKT